MSEEKYSTRTTNINLIRLLMSIWLLSTPLRKRETDISEKVDIDVFMPSLPYPAEIIQHTATIFEEIDTTYPLTTDFVHIDADNNSYDPIHEKLINAELLIAVEQKDIKKVRKLLKQGADPNITDISQKSLLEIMVEARNLDGVKILLAYGAHPNAHINIVLKANEYRSFDILKELFLYGADIHALYSPLNYSLLSNAVRENDLEKVKFFLKYTLDIRREDNDAILLSLNFYNIDRYSSKKFTLNELGIARKIFFLLLDKGISLNTYSSAKNYTPLISACNLGLLPEARELIERGADVTLKSNDGLSAFQHAIMSHQYDICDLLLNTKKVTPTDIDSMIDLFSKKITIYDFHIKNKHNSDLQSEIYYTEEKEKLEKQLNYLKQLDTNLLDMTDTWIDVSEKYTFILYLLSVKIFLKLRKLTSDNNQKIISTLEEKRKNKISNLKKKFSKSKNFISEKLSNLNQLKNEFYAKKQKNKKLKDFIAEVTDEYNKILERIELLNSKIILQEKDIQEMEIELIYFHTLPGEIDVFLEYQKSREEKYNTSVIIEDKRRIKQRFDSLKFKFKELNLSFSDFCTLNNFEIIKDLIEKIDFTLSLALEKIKHQNEKFTDAHIDLSEMQKFNDDLENSFNQISIEYNQLLTKPILIKNISALKIRFKILLKEVYHVEYLEEKYTFSISVLKELNNTIKAGKCRDTAEAGNVSRQIAEKQNLLLEIENHIHHLNINSSQMDIDNLHSKLGTCTDILSEGLITKAHKIIREAYASDQKKTLKSENPIITPHDARADIPGFMNMSERPLPSQLRKKKVTLPDKPPREIKEKSSKIAAVHSKDNLIQKKRARPSKQKPEHKTDFSFLTQNLEYAVNMTQKVNSVLHIKDGFFVVYPLVARQGMLGSMLFISGILALSLKGTTSGANLARINQNLKHNRQLIDNCSDPEATLSAFKIFCDQIQNMKNKDGFITGFNEGNVLLTQLLTPINSKGKSQTRPAKEGDITYMIETLRKDRQQIQDIYKNDADIWLVSTLAHDFIQAITGDNIGEPAINPLHIEYDLEKPTDCKISESRTAGNEIRHDPLYLKKLNMSYNKKVSQLTRENETLLTTVQSFSGSPISSSASNFSLVSSSSSSNTSQTSELIFTGSP